MWYSANPTRPQDLPVRDVATHRRPPIAAHRQARLGHTALDYGKRAQHASHVIERLQEPGRQEDRTRRIACAVLEPVQLDDVMDGTRPNPETPKYIDKIAGRHHHRVRKANRGKRGPSPIL